MQSQNQRVLKDQKYLQLKKKLDDLHYNLPFTTDSQLLVERLLTDLIKTTEGFQKLKQIQNNQQVTQEKQEIQIAIGALKNENKKLTTENNQLHEKIIQTNESKEKTQMEWKTQIISLQTEIRDLKFALGQKEDIIRQQQFQNINSSNKLSTVLQGKFLPSAEENQGLENMPPIYKELNRASEQNISQKNYEIFGQPQQQQQQKQNEQKQYNPEIQKMVNKLDKEEKDKKYNETLDSFKQEIYQLNKKIKEYNDSQSLQNQQIEYQNLQISNRDNEIKRLQQKIDVGTINMEKMQREYENSMLHEKVERLNHQIDLVNNENISLQKELSMYKGKGIERTVLDNNKLKTQNQELRNKNQLYEKRTQKKEYTIENIRAGLEEQVMLAKDQLNNQINKNQKLQDELNNNEQLIENLNSQVEILESQKQELTDKSENLKKQNEDLQNQLKEDKESHETQIQNLKDEHQTLYQSLAEDNEQLADKVKLFQQAANSTLEEKQLLLQNLLDDTKEKERQIKEYQELLTKSDENLRKLTVENDANKRKFKQLETDLDLQKSKLNQLNMDDKAANMIQENLQLKIQGLQEESDNLQSQLDHKTIQNTQFQNEIKQLRNQIIEKESLIDAYKNTPENNDQELKQKISNYQLLLSESERQNENLRQQIENLKSEKQNLSQIKQQEDEQEQEQQQQQNKLLQNTVKSKQTSVIGSNQLSKVIQEYQDQIDREQRINQKLHEELKEIQIQKLTLDEDLRNKDMELRIVQQQKNNLQQFSDKLQNQLQSTKMQTLKSQDLEVENSSLKNQVQMLDKKQRSVEELEIQIEELTKQLQELKLENQNKQDEFKGIILELNIKETEINNLKRMVIDKENQLIDYQDINQRLRQGSNLNYDTEKYIIQLQDERLELKSNIVNLQNEIQELKDLIDNYSRQLKQCQSQVQIEREKRESDLGNNITSLEAEKNDLKLYISELEKKSFDAQNLEIIIQNLREKLDSRQQDIQNLLQQKQVLKEENSELRLVNYKLEAQGKSSRRYDQPNLEQSQHSYTLSQSKKFNENELDRMQQERQQWNKSLKEKSILSEDLKEKVKILQQEFDQLQNSNYQY